MQNTCPICGVPIRPKSKRCRRHNLGCPAKKPKNLVCPDCGSAISRGGTYCVKCSQNHKHYTKHIERRTEPSADLNALPKEWIYQFVGLFYGEGTATIHKTNKGSYIPVLGLGMRIDESPIVEDMMQRIGGHYHIENRGSHLPMFRWQCTRLHEVLDLCHLFLEHTVIPARKSKELAILVQFCEWRLSVPFHVRDWTPAVEFLEQIRAIRQITQE